MRRSWPRVESADLTENKHVSDKARFFPCVLEYSVETRGLRG